MKRIALLLLLISLVGCQKDDAGATVSPPDVQLLYNTWQLTQIVVDNKVQDNSISVVVTFPKNGNYRDGLPNDTRWCCTASRYELVDNRSIRFIYQPSASCAAVNCLASPLTGDVLWQITTLTETSLVLTEGKTRLVFERRP